ncbi:hypothetical protein BJD20_05040 [Acinetobacter proteolyticus]|uniref:tetratricopeptide repeat protein n=1 Tax=Acinetobacter proteolyticus TaxID=1776741 RepID=UPI00086337D0|nr:hypothetical protein [Acinetobacter proteolyticus]OEY93528.1 hypothetical protein BJD20_05040 [Acinetobacter proteolyticus]
MYKKYYSSIVLFFLLIICFFIYFIGLKGNYLFDDYPNLQDLGTYGVIDSWDKTRAFIFNGFAGPTGRPISLASFLIDANTWPTDPYPFKYTNLMIHLLNGVFLCWAILLLLRNYQYEEKKAVWIALVSTAIWLLHPYFVSTTLYVVQRMAQLATLFSLIGIVGYLKARLLLSKKSIPAYMWMSLSVGLGTVLATFSKENGALLPLLILVIEFCNPNKENKPRWQWRAVCLWLPSIAIALILIKYMDFSAHPWPNRNFNMIERLYSEARIVSEYLYNLIVPQVELKGLYQDGFYISKSLTQPITTLYSIVFLFSLLLLALMFRKKYPLCALAILFFFTAHLMESTVIGLELYFEHRNYLSAIFLFLPIASGFYSLKKYIDSRLVYFIILLILSILSFFTYERAKLWGNTDQLQLYWAKNSPDSPRAQNAIAAVLFDKGNLFEANQYVQKAMQRLPDSALLNMRLLLQKVYAGVATIDDFEQTANRLKKQPFDAQAIQALRTLVEFTVDHPQTLKYANWSLSLISALEKNAKYNQFPLFQRLMPYLKAKIYIAQSKSELALKQYLEAISRYNDVEAGMMMVAELGSAKYYDEALILLGKVEKIYRRQDTKTLKRTQREYDFEIKRLREVLQQKLQNKNEGISVEY